MKETERHKLATGLEQHVSTYDVEVMNLEVIGDGRRVIGLKYRERFGEAREFELAGVFVQLGLVPNTDGLKGAVKLSPRGEGAKASLSAFNHLIRQPKSVAA